MAGVVCISPAHCAITGAVARSRSRQQQQVALPSSSYSGDSVSPFLHAGICSTLRTRARSLAPRRHVLKSPVTESVLADIAEESPVCGLFPSRALCHSLSHSLMLHLPCTCDSVCINLSCGTQWCVHIFSHLTLSAVSHSLCALVHRSANPDFITTCT